MQILDGQVLLGSLLFLVWSVMCVLMSATLTQRRYDPKISNLESNLKLLASNFSVYARLYELAKAFDNFSRRAKECSEEVVQLIDLRERATTDNERRRLENRRREAQREYEINEHDAKVAKRNFWRMHDLAKERGIPLLENPRFSDYLYRPEVLMQFFKGIGSTDPRDLEKFARGEFA